MSEIELKEKVFQALSDKRYDYRTASGIARCIGVGIEKVLDAIRMNSDSISEGPFRKGSEKIYFLKSNKSEWSCIYDLFAYKR